MLRRPTLPRAELVAAFVRACGCPLRNVNAWLASHHRLARRRGPSRPPHPDPAAAEPTPPAPPTGRPLPRAVIPSQLPLTPGAFTGREAELRALDRATTGADRVALVVVTGLPGIGKTSFALRYAHQFADRYGDGHLYLDLRGHAPDPTLTPIEALERLARGLGAEAGRTRTTVEEAAARYRSLLADRKVLLLLDNAASAEQVRPLLPGAAHSLTLVTSRRRLSGLLAGEGAHRIRLGVLPAEDARRLLARLLGARRVDAAPEQTAALIDACAGLPLALRIAATQLADEPWRPLQDYVAELREHGLAVLALDDERHTVSAVFDLSYRQLAPGARRIFRLLGLAPDRDLTMDALAALNGTTPTTTRTLVRALTDAHLLDEHAPGRYHLHDLLRQYARHLAETEDPTDARAEALDRLTAWHHRATTAAA
ncbi:NB-ARC domain-containing protein [Streptomyces sp. DSM 44915]|uniref:NB-ARC domain-containing protein n=1 Tax=Streptomyces chisholmiae TaxID=3075540 RepID=A0ABU2JUD8_9ACTN|nr:NB-ARC domain-containing protein [Streptomyces sp. DSM 44915]MDT0268605.1 NB-ARC domain-containing protein [Streptomyces sp. DSM 44915]